LAGRNVDGVVHGRRSQKRFIFRSSRLLLVGRARRRCSDRDNTATRVQDSASVHARRNRPRFSRRPPNLWPGIILSLIFFPADHCRPLRILRPRLQPHAARVFICVNNNYHRSSVTAAALIDMSSSLHCRRTSSLHTTIALVAAVAVAVAVHSTVAAPQSDGDATITIAGQPCKCVPFYLCESSNTVDIPSG